MGPKNPTVNFQFKKQVKSDCICWGPSLPMDRSLRNYALCSHGHLRADGLWSPVLANHSESFSKPQIHTKGFPLTIWSLSIVWYLATRKEKWLMSSLVTRWAVRSSTARSLSFWQAAAVQAPCPRGQQKARGRAGGRIQGAQGKNSFLRLDPLWNLTLDRWYLLSPSVTEPWPEAWRVGVSKPNYWSALGFKIT